MQLDALAAAEGVDNGAEGYIHRAVQRGQVVEPLAAAEGDGAEADAVLGEHHGDVMAAGAQRFGRGVERDAGGAEQRPGVALAERGQPLDLLNGLKGERAERGFDVDEEFGDALFEGDARGCHFTERAAKAFELMFFDFQAGRRRMTAVRDQELTALGQSRVKIEAGHAAG